MKDRDFLDISLGESLRLDGEKLLYLLILGLAIVTRLWDLGSRAYNHDESLHAFYSWRLFKGQGYVHNPMMHGPFLFEFSAFIFTLFGATDFTGRLPAAIFGVILVGLPYFLRKWLGKVGALVAAGLLLISPSFLYFSRFIRHDIFNSVSTLLMVIALFKYLDERQTKHLYWGAAAVTLSLSTKEVSYVFGFIALSFIALMTLWEAWDKGRERVFIPALRTIYLPGLMVSLAIAVVIFAVLYTTFFTNIAGLGTGTIGAVLYWLKQHGVQRGGQPWFYYFLLLPLYEFLPLLLSLIGVGCYARRRWLGLEPKAKGASAILVPFLLWWIFLSLIIYSWAGEKMPWLGVHLTLPLILLASRFIDEVFEAADWEEIRRGGGGYLALLVPLLLYLVSVLFRALPFQGVSLEELGQTMRWMSALCLGAILVWLAARYARRLGARQTFPVLLFATFACLSVLTLHYSLMASFRHGDVATEMLVYAQGATDVTRVMRKIERVGDISGEGQRLVVAYDDESSWPFQWYLRDYPNQVYFGKKPTDPLNAPVVLVGAGNERGVKPYLEDYVRERYIRLWWFVEDYKGLSWQMIVRNLRDPKARQNFWNALFYRRFETPLGLWPLRSEAALYLRKDVASRTWAGEPLPLVEEGLLAYEEQRVRMESELIWGREGQGEGELLHPKDLAVDRWGNVYVADTGNHRIEKFASDGRFLLSWGREGRGEGEFKEPWGLGVDEEGRLYVADTWNHRVQVFDGEGHFLWQVGSGELVDLGGKAEGGEGLFYGPRDVAVDGQGRVYVTDTGNKRAQVFDREGNYLGQFGGYGVGEGQFHEPVGIGIDRRSGRTYVADTWNRRIERFDRNWKYEGEWAVEGWEGESVLSKPYLVVDGEGRIYTSDPEGHRVLVYDGDGKLLKVWGEYGVGRDSFNLPTGVAVDGKGRVYVADSFNNRVMRFAPVRFGR